MRLTRKEFLALTSGVLASLGGSNRVSAESPVVPESHPTKSLVIIYMAGGNDGLNTVAPYGLGEYYDLRPNVCVDPQEALALSNRVGLHPNLTGLKSLYDKGQVAVVQGVGYPNPDRSHFRSFDIWATAHPEGTSPVGWLGRYLDLKPGGSRLRAVAAGLAVPKPLASASGAALASGGLNTMHLMGRTAEETAIKAMYTAQTSESAPVRARGQAVLELVHEIRQLTSGYSEKVTYPDDSLATSLQMIVELIACGAGTEIFYTQFGSFDEHAGGKSRHAQLMTQFDEAITAFQKDLEANGLQDRVVTLVYSEFGRRARENGTGGTDHGKAGPALLIGAPVQGGLVGDHPSLTDLSDGDLRMGIDFRSIYASLLTDWLSGPADDVLGGRFEKLPLLKA